MRKQITCAAALFFLLTLAAANGHAQTSNSRFRAYIPFQFTVGDKTLPAGEYVFEQTNRATLRDTLRISSNHSTRDVLVPAWRLAGTPREMRLVFHRYGEVSYLSQLQGMDGEQGLQLVESRAEHALRLGLKKNVLARTGGAVAQGAPEYRAVTILLRRM
jgi:hypothetical protein